MPLIGTAGHVDHGKSTLIERLTGRDPDRWDEEKERGLTIDLGFGWTTLLDGQEVSFVDVPGHERYLKNMLAGIEAIDIALFVVAADEGWMPQSEEHLAVLDLLEVGSGVVALTKVDLVDSDLVELAQLEVIEKTGGTSLEGIQVMPVSSTTGEGIDSLVAELANLAADASARDIDRPRMWIDRSFSAAGSGTIVTGTLLDGSLSLGDNLTVYPGDRSVRVRGIQSHETQLDVVGPGRRAALNIAGVERDEVTRGDLIGREGDWNVTTRFLCSLKTARYVGEIDKRGAYQLHVGSGVSSMAIVGLEPDTAVIQTDHPLPLAYGDRFIVRDTGRKLVVAGGRVLDPSPGPTRIAMSTSAGLASATTPDEVANVLLQLRGTEDVDRLSRDSLGGVPDGVIIKSRAFSQIELNRLNELIIASVCTAHEEHPLRVGLPLATLASSIGVTNEIAESLVDRQEEIVRIGPDVASVSHTVSLSDDQKQEWSKAKERLGSSLDIPTAAELGLQPELVHLKQRSGELVAISGDLLFLPDQVELLKSHLQSMEGDFTVAEFRDATGLSRKYAVPILEWADKEGLTVRRGDTRRVR